MHMEDERRYHEQRACQELDCAYYSDHPRAAEAHLRISALHMERARALLNFVVERKDEIPCTVAA